MNPIEAAQAAQELADHFTAIAQLVPYAKNAAVLAFHEAEAAELLHLLRRHMAPTIEDLVDRMAEAAGEAVVVL